MAKKTSNYNLSIEERLEQALIPKWDEPYKLPDNWCWVKLDSMVDILNGYAFKSALYTDIGIRIIRITNVQEGFIEDEKPVYYPYKAESEISQYMLRNNDLLMSLTGNVGRVALMKDEFLPSALNQRVACLRTKLSTVDIKYLFYFFLQKSFIDDCTKSSKGSAQLNMSTEWLKRYAIPLPPLFEQHRIVQRIESLFEKLDEAKEKAQEVMDGFETRKAAILHKAFSGELTAKWREENIAKENDIINQIKNLSLEWTNKDQKLLLAEQKKAIKFTMSYKHQWIKCTIGAVAQVNNGSTPSRKIPDYWNGTIPWVSSGEVKNNIIYSTEESISQNGFENASVKLLPVDTVLIAMIGEGKTRGQSAILKIPATINQNIAAIIIDHGLIKSKYLWYWLQMNYSKNREKGSGSGPQALNCQKVRELDFVFPDINEQIEIVRILDILISKEIQVKEIAENVIDQIDTMKKAILARAFRGELGTNDPSEENAVELLKNILTGDYYEDKKNNCKEIQKSY